METVGTEVNRGFANCSTLWMKGLTRENRSEKVKGGERQTSDPAADPVPKTQGTLKLNRENERPGGKRTRGKRSQECAHAMFWALGLRAGGEQKNKSKEDHLEGTGEKDRNRQAQAKR